MPAVGFAMLLNIMLKKEYMPFLITGFVLVAYMHFTTIGNIISCCNCTL